jgi:hypothetical protein
LHYLLSLNLFSVATFKYAPQGQEMFPDIIPVTWVSVHPSYTKSNGESDVAIVGTLWSLEFSDVIAPMCVYNDESDTNLRTHVKLTERRVVFTL